MSLGSWVAMLLICSESMHSCVPSWLWINLGEQHTPPATDELDELDEDELLLDEDELLLDEPPPLLPDVELPPPLLPPPGAQV